MTRPNRGSGRLPARSSSWARSHGIHSALIGGNDAAADPFNDLRHDRVSELADLAPSDASAVADDPGRLPFVLWPRRGGPSVSVQPDGKPIRSSHQRGFNLRPLSLADARGVGHRRTAIARGTPKPLPLACFLFCCARRRIQPVRLSPSLKFPAAGVGHKPEAIATLGGADGVRRYTVPFRLIPERDQVTNDFFDRCWVPQSASVLVEPRPKEPWNVFHEDVAGSTLANGTGELRPEPPLIVLRMPKPGRTDGLARESSGHNVNGLDSAPVDGGDIAIDGEAGPVAGKDVAAVGVDLAEPASDHAGTLQTEVDAANAREEAADAEGQVTRPIPCPSAPPLPASVGPYLE